MEIKTTEPEYIFKTTEVPQTSTTEHQVDVLKSSLDVAIGLIKEAPKFIFLFGSKMFEAAVGSNESVSSTEANVFSVLKERKT